MPTACRYHVGMKPQARYKQYTLRGIPHHVDVKLKALAAAQGKSLNQFVIEELSRTAGEPLRRNEFSDLCGAWAPDEAMDAIFGSQRQIDLDKWQ
ncbi:MAG: toxin-antitoxin system HicB family antitoxin [Bryobacterales bacterium]|nr:toxin-antitoxin system HicB family antitoxin [Bryobacterales bacterium]